jgi:hypothetical protein
MAKGPKKLDELFHDTLKDIYFAEKKDPERTAEDGEGRAGRQAPGSIRKAAGYVPIGIFSC